MSLRHYPLFRCAWGSDQKATGIQSVAFFHCATPIVYCRQLLQGKEMLGAS